MARELTEDAIPVTRPHKPVDWSKYDTGRPWELVQGVDYTQDTKAAAHALRQWAYYRGRKVTIRRKKDRMIIFLHPKESEQGR